MKFVTCKFHEIHTMNMPNIFRLSISNPKTWNLHHGGMPNIFRFRMPNPNPYMKDSSETLSYHFNLFISHEIKILNYEIWPWVCHEIHTMFICHETHTLNHEIQTRTSFNLNPKPIQFRVETFHYNV